MTRVRVLGELTVVGSAGGALSIPRGLPRQLLAYLALHRRPVPRREVADHLWPDVDRDLGLRRLRTALWEVQRVLTADAATVVDSARTTLSLSPWVVVDLDEAESLLQSGAAEAALRLLEPGLSAELDQEWAVPARRRAEALLLDALQRLVEECTDPQVAGGYARRRVELDPLSESAHQDLIRCLAVTGDRSAAFAAYARMRDVLSRELGTPPSGESRRLLARLASGEALPEAPPPGVVDRPRQRGRVPLPATAMLGRDRDLATVVRDLREDRLVTIVGIGGMGKSRLAVAVAEKLRDQGPVTFVELAATRQPETCLYVVAAQLGVVAGQGRAIEDAITDYLEAEPGLLVLDNCEHVRDRLAGLVAEILARCGGTRILATSRERLGIPGERVVPLPPLGVPAADDSEDKILTASSVRLLIDAAARRGAPPEALQDAAALRDLARRLDGIPLALELAGGRLTTFEAAGLNEILQRGLSLLSTTRSGVVGRHDSLERTFDWSLSTLAPEDRRLLGLMATCPGALPFDLIDTLGRAPADEGDPTAGLAHLVEAGLVRARPDPHWTYSMLEPVRLHAEEKLSEVDRRFAEAGLLRWAIAFCRRVDDLLEADEIEASAQFDLNFPLIRQAVYTARAHDDFDAERRIVHAVEPWATWRRAEVWNWVLDLANDPQGRSDDARTFARAAVASRRQGRMDAMRAFTDRCVRADPDSYEANDASLALAWAEGRWADVVHFATRLDERSCSASAIQRGLCAGSLVFLGELDAALEMAEQSHGFAERTGMPTVRSLALEMLGRVYAARRRAGIDAPDPNPFLLEARRQARSVASVEMEAAICAELARQAFLDERHADAVEPLLFVSEYWLTGGHRVREDESMFRLLIEALSLTGRAEAAATLTDLTDAGRLTLRGLREVVVDHDSQP